MPAKVPRSRKPRERAASPRRRRRVGTQVDFSAYERKGHEQDAVFDSSALQRELGYKLRVDVRTAYNMRGMD